MLPLMTSAIPPPAHYGRLQLPYLPGPPEILTHRQQIEDTKNGAVRYKDPRLSRYLHQNKPRSRVIVTSLPTWESYYVE